VFKISNDQAFSTYRLQIDRIRDRRVANPCSAEIELMGRTETIWIPCYA